MVSVLKPKSVLALTATATPEVEEDVRHILHIEEAKRVLYLPQRNNLHLSSEDFRSDGQIYQAIAAIEGQSICYCATVKRVNELYASMGGSIKGGATCYTGKMTPAERDAAQNAFMCGDVNCVFATNAFGLGIDRSCIRGIVHADAPASLDALSQEQGRAGRDGLDAYCTAFFSDKAYGTQLYFIDVRYPEAEIVRRVYAYLKTHADKAGIVKMTIEQIAGAVGERSDGAGAAMSILANFKVLDRSKDSDSVHNVRFVKPHLQEEYARFVPAIEKIGFKNDRGFWEFDVTALAEALSLKPKKVADSLKDLSTNGYIQWTAPFRGKISRIVGNVDLVDFDYLARRRELSIKRLGILWKYHRVPDESKHDFISEYFRNGTA
jgi:superfamily II DNA/RNA helicase